MPKLLPCESFRFGVVPGNGLAVAEPQPMPRGKRGEAKRQGSGAELFGGSEVEGTKTRAWLNLITTELQEGVMKTRMQPSSRQELDSY